MCWNYGCEPHVQLLTLQKTAKLFSGDVHPPVIVFTEILPAVSCSYHCIFVFIIIQTTGGQPRASWTFHKCSPYRSNCSQSSEHLGFSSFLYLFSYSQLFSGWVCLCHPVPVKVRGQSSWVSSIELRSPGWHSKYLYLLNSLALHPSFFSI